MPYAQTNEQRQSISKKNNNGYFTIRAAENCLPLPAKEARARSCSPNLPCPTNELSWSAQCTTPTMPIPPATMATTTTATTNTFTTTVASAATSTATCTTTTLPTPLPTTTSTPTKFTQSVFSTTVASTTCTSSIFSSAGPITTPLAAIPSLNQQTLTSTKTTPNATLEEAKLTSKNSPHIVSNIRSEQTQLKRNRDNQSPNKLEDNNSNKKQKNANRGLTQTKIQKYWLSAPNTVNRFEILQTEDNGTNDSGTSTKNTSPNVNKKNEPNQNKNNKSNNNNSNNINNNSKNPNNNKNNANSNNINKTNNTEISPTKKKNNKPPPIYVQGAQEIKALTSALTKTIGSNSYLLKYLPNDEVKIQTNDPEQYSATMKMLRSYNTKYYTFKLKEDRNFKVVLRNMHPKADTDEIKTELLELGHVVQNIHNIQQKNTKKPLALFVVELKQQPNNKEIYDITSLMHTKIIFEPPHHKRVVAQCTNCQKYGHTKNFCTCDPVCVKCAGDHKTLDCELRINEGLVKCALCSGSHTANYKGCEIYKALKIRRFPPLREKKLDTVPLNTANDDNVVKPTLSFANVAANKTTATCNNNDKNEQPKNDDLIELKEMMKQLITQMTSMMNIVTLLISKLDDRNK